MPNLLQNFLVQREQSNRNAESLLWSPPNNNSSTVTIDKTNSVSQYFQDLQTYSTRLKLKQNTKYKLKYASIFLCHYDYLTHLQKDMRFWFGNCGQKP